MSKTSNQNRIMRRKKTTNNHLKYISLLVFLFIGAGIIGFILSQQEKEAEDHSDKSKQASVSGTESKGSLDKHQLVDNTDETTTLSKPSEPEEIIEQKVNKLLLSMTLEEKIGQLVVIGFPSKQIDEHVREMVEEYNVGGIIYYDRNMETPKQVAKLTNDLQNLALETDNQIPLIISIDQEGGQIVRMKNQISDIPSQQELGKSGDLKKVYQTALKNGQELKAMGVNVNFAPVLDLSTTDSRSFGEDPKTVSELGKQAITGYTDSGITATLKHFPGNGRSDIDPHYETSSVEANRLDLENNDIYPFKMMIEEVNNQSFFTMVTHIKYPAYDKENPASISQTIIQDLLREKLGYNGIVVTDDLEMGAVNKYFSYQDLGFRAVEAGADLLLVCHTLESQQEVIKGIKIAVLDNKLSEERINEAVKRILSYKFSAITSTYTE